MVPGNCRGEFMNFTFYYIPPWRNITIRINNKRINNNTRDVNNWVYFLFLAHGISGFGTKHMLIYQFSLYISCSLLNLLTSILCAFRLCGNISKVIGIYNNFTKVLFVLKTELILTMKLTYVLLSAFAFILFGSFASFAADNKSYIAPYPNNIMTSSVDKLEEIMEFLGVGFFTRNMGKIVTPTKIAYSYHSSLLFLTAAVVMHILMYFIIRQRVMLDFNSLSLEMWIICTNSSFPHVISGIRINSITCC